uniref:superinfection exclusion B family protein n=1 Tax=Microbulbifer agarilyticus TaxID=260552 RepID=UPI000255B94A|nr:superinfection exclusion B family protein [Microbulbifer agarilyticus]
MIEALNGFLNSVKQTSPTIFSGLVVATGIVLFSTSDLIDEIGLMDFREQNKAYIGACFILSLSILASQASSKVFQIFKSIILKRKKRKNKAQVLERRKRGLAHLTPDEKAYLAPYIFDQKTTQYFLLEDGVKGSLEAKAIIYRASNVGDMVDGWAYNIQPWAKDHLENNPQLLDGYTREVGQHSRW